MWGSVVAYVSSLWACLSCDQFYQDPTTRVYNNTPFLTLKQQMIEDSDKFQIHDIAIDTQNLKIM